MDNLLLLSIYIKCTTNSNRKSDKNLITTKAKDVLKVGLSPSHKICFICFNESPYNDKTFFYFILKVLFVLKIFRFLSWLFGHVENTAWLEER